MKLRRSLQAASDKIKDNFKGIILFIVSLCLIFAALLAGFIYRPSPAETPCRDIPEGTVVIALAFTHAGKDFNSGKYLPGEANKMIKQKLEECADRFSIVLTQKAVSDALDDENRLKNGVIVVQMHKDNAINVRTLEALCCAVERLSDYPEDINIGLIAHDKQYKRARRALEAVLKQKKTGAKIVDIHLGKTPYQDDASYRPWCWAARELFLAKPVQRLRAALGCFECSSAVAIPEKLPYVDPKER